MATIYTYSESNIRKTWLFFTFFLIFNLAVGCVFAYMSKSFTPLIFGVIYSIVMGFGSYWYSDRVVLMMSKAKLIQKQDNPELYRLVENLCIASGLPLPRIYILNEAQPNAFATGRDKNHAVIAVTRGLLEKLDKTELEGVIAHELSHIGNKDMLLMTLVVVMVGFASVVSDWFLRSLFWGGFKSRDNDDNKVGAVIALVGLVLMIIAPIVALMIQMAISRKREFLADSSAALLTRYPEGLARALEKIASDKTPLRVASGATAHMYIENPFRGKNVSSLFMTHPPVAQRIKALKDMEINA